MDLKVVDATREAVKERLSRKEFTRTQVRLMLSSALIFRDFAAREGNEVSHEEIVNSVLDLHDFVQQRLAEVQREHER